jgi:hypothetical protein
MRCLKWDVLRLVRNVVLKIVVHDQNLYTNYTSGALRL